MLEQEPKQVEQEEKPKKIRILLESDDGKIRFLEGTDAERWWQSVIDATILVNLTVAGQNPLPWKFDWKEIDRTEVLRLFETPKIPPKNS